MADGFATADVEFSLRANTDGEPARWWAILLTGIALVAANLVPLWGVLALGWDVFSLLFLYWLESAIMAAFGVLRLILNRSPEPFKWELKAGAVPAFVFMQVIGLTIHGVFVFLLFSNLSLIEFGFSVRRLLWHVIQTNQMTIPALAMLGSHALSFAWNYLHEGERRRWLLGEEVHRPLGRMVALHAAVIAGGLLVWELAALSALPLVLLVIAKTVADLILHSRYHRWKVMDRRRRAAAAVLAIRALPDGWEQEALGVHSKGYLRDNQVEWQRKRVLLGLLCGWGVLAGAAIALALGDGPICLLLGVATWFASTGLGAAAALIYQRDGMPCPVCNGTMTIAEVPLPLTAAATTDEGRALMPTVWQRWYVCHTCRRYVAGRTYPLGYKPQER